MSTEEIKEYIDRYIDIHATGDNLEKGLSLYKTGKVSMQFYQDGIDTWVFSVRDAKNYKVQIRNIKQKYAQSTCNCPYIHGGTCMHTVAALLYISDIDGDVANANQASQNFDSDRSELGYELSEFRFIADDLIREHCATTTFNEVYYHLNHCKLLAFSLQDDAFTFDLLLQDKEHKVVFTYQDEKVYISSSPKVISRKLTVAEAICLMKIARSASPDIFEVVFTLKMKNLKELTMQQYGLSVAEEFEKFFTLDFCEEKGIIVVEKPEAKGLLPVENVESSPFITFVETVGKDALAMDHLKAINKEHRSLGFVIAFDGFNNQYKDKQNFERFELIPIIGKPSKANDTLSTHITFYRDNEDQYFIEISKNAAELIRLSKEIDNADTHKSFFKVQQLILELLANEPFVFQNIGDPYGLKKSDLVPLKMAHKFLDAVYVIREDEEFVLAELKLKLGHHSLSFKSINQETSGEFIYDINGTFYTAKNYNVAMHIANYKASIKMVKAHKKDFFERVVKPLGVNFELEFKDGIYNVDSVELDFEKKQIFLSEKENYLIIEPHVEYHQGVSVHLNTLGNVLVSDDENITEYKRNFELEDDFVNLIAEMHQTFELQKSDKSFYLHYNEFSQDMWFYRFFDALQANDIEVYGLKDLKNFKYSPYKGRIHTHVTSGEDWFELKVDISFGDNKVSLKDIKRAVLKNQKYIKLNDGSVGVLPNEWIHKLEKYFRHGEINDDVIEVSKLRFSIIDELFENIDDLSIMKEVMEKRERLAKFTQIEETIVPEEIRADLRPYQKEGLNWLNFLDEMGWGGILADDMGLGKTLQILTFLQMILKKDSTTNLIVVPTTLLFNWENEIEKFAPNLKAHYHYGISRVKDTNDFKGYDIIFTTYGLLLRDIEMLRKFQFNYVILDESQAIKNPASRRFKAANLLSAKNRIALSGTPIENSTFDLYAQMSFVNKGFFGGPNSFRDSFSNAIDKDGDEARGAELQRLINPFILRRTKERVASELPPKTEDVIFCEMETEQRKVYDAYRNEFKSELQKEIESGGLAKAQIKVLAALTRLRQICDSPQLIRDENFTTTDSVKIREIIQHITDKTSKHKILIFSQFVKMLTLVREELGKRNIAYEYLDGQSSTTQRSKSVENFQEDEDLRVFLISLKAGGTGLNLTAADYVYILDPWWNPAVENQAIDRCYRIGQEKKVFAYRLICKNTVEEKILKLQSKKKKIAGDIVQTDENIMKSLDVQDIQELFS